MLRACLIALLLGSAVAAHAEDAAGVLARFKTASGASRWDAAQSWHGDGKLSSGGLSGEFHVTVDLLSGRSVDTYELGPVNGADGYDGARGWERDPGGEVAALDAPEAVRRARGQAWLDARAYWYPQRMAATYTEPQTRQADGKSYRVLTATPKDGDPVTLWFADDTGLLARVEQRQGQDTAITRFEDYRDVDGLRLPFLSVVDLTDAAGRTDPRRRTEIRLERIALNVAVDDADFAMPAMLATARIGDASGVARIPFELINNHIYVHGAIDGKPVRLMVDTGGVNLLTPAAAKRLGIAGEGKLAAGGVGNERVDLALAHARVVSVGTAGLANPVFYILDLGQLAAVEGVEFDGLVGYEMFRRFGVEIDYASRQLTLTDPGKFVAPADATAVPFELDDRIPIASGKLDGLPIRISIDTGSRSSITLHSPFVQAHGLVARYHAAAECVTGWGVGGAQRGNPARLGTLQLGDLSIDGTAADLFTGRKGSFANPDIGGNIGGGVLRRFTVTFDYANRKMYVKPNAAFAAPDAFDRSGLWLLADGDALEVADAASDSAASRAGLRQNDRIVAIGDESVSKRSLAEWRERLRELPAGTTLAVRFQRAGRAKTVELTLADRIPATRQ